ncbi:MAG: hypothetical protein HXY43_01370 [Fischerella sp.]|jgi:hypothetical protein|uniref:SCO5389 family protein n=1 Tax=unclassified Fischerella TaxID=494603 RepID=UPI000478E7F8|nr:MULTISPECIES: SCO5389 family protein [unclassified Fischerella]NWF57988.1 hypothetical protein [Fischerella sp.]
MSLNVNVHLIDQAKAGKVNEAEFVDTIRESLPYAWGIVESLAERLARGEEWANHCVAPPTEKHRAQLLRMMGGDAIRGAVERYFGIKLAFQNCHNVAAFRPENLDSSAYLNFISIESQILNQTPELVDC